MDSCEGRLNKLVESSVPWDIKLEGRGVQFASLPIEGISENSLFRYDEVALY